VTAPLVREVLHVDATTTAPLDELARVTSRALTREVSRSAVVRAAVIAWLDGAERGPLGVVIDAIRAAAQRSSVQLRRYPQRWPKELAARLDRFARSAARALACRVSRSAVVRVAIAVWLAAAQASPAVVTEAIRVALVRRGRKAKR
jgi:predicted transcriptional regulator